MVPQIELYLNVERDWVSEALVERYQQVLQTLLPELMAHAKGPDHVLSELEVIEISIVDDDTITTLILEVVVSRSRFTSADKGIIDELLDRMAHGTGIRKSNNRCCEIMEHIIHCAADQELVTYLKNKWPTMLRRKLKPKAVVTDQVVVEETLE